MYFRSVAVVLICALPLHAGVVLTPSARLEGKVLFEKDAVSVDGKTIAWADVLYLLPDFRPASIRGQRVHLKNGENWAVDIVSLTGEKLEVRSDRFGVKKLDLGLVAGLDFVAQAGTETERKIDVLYRVKGESIPGKLLSITAGKVTIDSAVGELDLPRDGLSSFRFAAVKNALPSRADEVALIDGSLLYGKLSLEEAGTKLEHAVFGAIKLPVNVIRAVVRHPPRMLDVLELPLRLVESTPVVPTAKQTGEPFRAVSGLNAAAPTFVKGLLIEPKTVIACKLPGKDQGKGKLRIFVSAAAGSKGDVRLTIRAADKVLLQRDLGPAAKAEMVSLDVQAGQELHIAVDFGDPLRFPCAAVLGDPHVVWDQSR